MKFIGKIALISTFSAMLASNSCSKKTSSQASNKLLRIGSSQEFEILHPIISQMGISAYIFKMTNRALVSLNADWELYCTACKTIPTLENGLAKKLPNGKMHVDWELKDDLKWGDGTEVTATDVKFAWEVGNNMNVAIPFRDIYTRVEAIDIDPENPKKFRMTFSKQRYDFASIPTFYILPRHLEGEVFEKTKGSSGQYEKQTKFNTDPTNPGLYFGPYVVSELKLASHVTLVPNPYFAKQPKIEKILFKLIPNNQALEANLLAGAIDMVPEPTIFNFDQLLGLMKRIEDDPKLGERIKVAIREGTIFEHVTFNLKSPIVSDVRVRKALAYASDRESLVKALFDDKLKVAHQDTHPLDPYYNPDVTKYNYDLEQANELLDRAGWKLKDDGIRYREEQPLNLSLMTTAQNSTREQVQVYLQAQWKKIGANVSIKNEPPRVFFGETVRKGAFPDMAMFAWISSPDNPPMTILHSGSIPTKENSYAGQNTGGYINKLVDKHLEDITTEFSFEKRKAHMALIQKFYSDELPALPLYLRAEAAVVPQNLKGFRVTGHQFYSSVSVEDWHF